MISTQSNDYVLDLLGTTEEKLVKLLEELENKDLEGVLKEMRQLDVRKTLLLSILISISSFSIQLQYNPDGKLPAHNTRINAQSTTKGNIYAGLF